MKIWLPDIKAGTGTDVFTLRLADALIAQGCEVEVTAFSKAWQYFPGWLKRRPAPLDADIVVTNSWNGFAFKRAGARLITVVHHCVHDSALRPYKNVAQRIFHSCFVKRFERRSILDADQALAVSQYTADRTADALNLPTPAVIHNAVDTDFFHPEDSGIEFSAKKLNAPIRLLFVGNLSVRKGADLLPAIMERLGAQYELRYTAGLRDGAITALANMVPLGRLSDDELRNEYRRAAFLLFPTRLEGFGYAAIEAMACGTPVVASDCSSLPEVVEDGVAGRLCPVNDVDSFIAAIQDIARHPERYAAMCASARDRTVERFSLEAWGKAYVSLFGRLLAE